MNQGPKEGKKKRERERDFHTCPLPQCEGREAHLCTDSKARFQTQHAEEGDDWTHSLTSRSPDLLSRARSTEGAEE